MKQVVTGINNITLYFLVHVGFYFLVEIRKYFKMFSAEMFAYYIWGMDSRCNNAHLAFFFCFVFCK